MRDGEFAFVRGRWKLVARRRGQAPALFDAATDPDELVDLAAERPALAEELALELAERRAAYAEGGYGATSAELSETLRRDLDALGYGGDAYESGEGR